MVDKYRKRDLTVMGRDKTGLSVPGAREAREETYDPRTDRSGGSASSSNSGQEPPHVPPNMSPPVDEGRLGEGSEEAPGSSHDDVDGPEESPGEFDSGILGTLDIHKEWPFALKGKKGINPVVGINVFMGK